MSTISNAAVADRRDSRVLDRLAMAAAAIALVPLPLLGIAHPVSQLLVVGIVVAFAWSEYRSAPACGIWRALGLTRPWLSTFSVLMLAIGAVTAVVRWLLYTRVLAGRGGLAFYDAVMRSYGVLDAAGHPHWLLLAPLAAAVFVLILLDGLFYVGLIQRRLVVRVGTHAAVWMQAALFGLVHTFSGARADVAYGAGSVVAGVAYGYVYGRCGSHWIPATMLWLHVMGVFVLLAAVR